MAEDEDISETIRDTPLGACIGRVLLDITADDTEDYLADPERKSRVYFHFDNGETIYCTIGTDGQNLLGMLGTEDEDDAV